ncbi:molecular chaperone TorD [Motiliproteus coralliicola]|uniref:Chaperone protein TorD n=1 Tax=Motiliproteus coralliicola TaxID=2283196 RepID=A0A369WBA3_9GAMM|nr:molecular chaperone TorD [Motiliproteus coralliicola]RDE18937.1 molecular chaperone TorD [Motiliproteus coralliicola]
MNSFSELSETRASIYWWFSTLFASELNDEQLQAYCGEEGRDFLQGLADNGLSEEVGALQQVLQQLAAQDQPRLELAADFTQCFLVDQKSSALPYASVYLSDDGLLYQQPHLDMLDLLQSEGLAVNEGMNEPADHLAIMLDYLGNLVMQGVNSSSDAEQGMLLEKQLSFIEQQLMSWVPAFVERTQQLKQTFFYPKVAMLLLAYLRLDQTFLSD